MGRCKEGSNTQQLWAAWSAVYCLGNQTADQTILEKLRVSVFPRSWKCWRNLYRLWSVIVMLRSSGALHGYQKVK